MPDERPIPAWAAVVLVLVEIGCIPILYVAFKAHRFRGFWQRNYVQMRMRDPSLTPVAFARQAIPLYLFVMAIVGAILPLAVFGPGAAQLWVTLALFALVVVLGVLLLVVRRTGRPRILVLGPFRDADNDEAGVLLRATYVFEFAIGDPPEFAIEAAVLAGDRAEALRLLRSVGVSRNELSLWTAPSRILNVGEPDYLETTVPAWRRLGDTRWVNWNDGVPR